MNNVLLNEQDCAILVVKWTGLVQYLAGRQKRVVSGIDSTETAPWLLFRFDVILDLDFDVDWIFAARYRSLFSCSVHPSLPTVPMRRHTYRMATIGLQENQN